jgi:hypothetical protein
MIRLQTRAPLAAHQLTVQALMEDGEPFGAVEDAIDDLDRGTEEKAALWLLAWSLQEPHLQRRRAQTTLQTLARNA